MKTWITALVMVLAAAAFAAMVAHAIHALIDPRPLQPGTVYTDPRTGCQYTVVQGSVKGSVVLLKRYGDNGLQIGCGVAP